MLFQTVFTCAKTAQISAPGSSKRMFNLEINLHSIFWLLLSAAFSLESLVTTKEKTARILIRSKTKHWPVSFVQKIHIQKCIVFCVNTLPIGGEKLDLSF